MKSYSSILNEINADSLVQGESIGIETLRTELPKVLGSNYVVRAATAPLGKGITLIVHGIKPNYGIAQNSPVFMSLLLNLDPPHGMGGLPVIAWEGNSRALSVLKYRKIKSSVSVEDAISKLLAWFKKVKPQMDTLLGVLPEASQPSPMPEFRLGDVVDVLDEDGKVLVSGAITSIHRPEGEIQPNPDFEGYNPMKYKVAGRFWDAKPGQIRKQENAASLLPAGLGATNIEAFMVELVDKFGIDNILDELSDVCGFKAEELANSDLRRSDVWQKLEDRLASLSQVSGALK